MRLLFVIAICAAMMASARAQMGITYFPGPGMPAATSGGGCTMNGTIDLTNTCNDIYYLTGVLS